MKEFADDNFEIKENGRKFSIKVDSTVKKKEKLLVWSNFPFSPPPHCVFKRLVVQTRACFGKCYNPFSRNIVHRNNYMYM